MRFFLPLIVLIIGMMSRSVVHAQLVTHCRPDGAGGFICQPERVGPPELATESVGLIRRAIQSQIPTIPYTMTPDEMTAVERYGGTATNEERAAQPGSQFQVCEDRLQKIGYAHLDQCNACTGLSIHAPTQVRQAAFIKAKDAEDAARFAAADAAQWRVGEALRDKIAAERAKQ